MATRETKADRGRRLGRDEVVNLTRELRETRVRANTSQRALAKALGWSHTRYGRFEKCATGAVSVLDLAAVASLLGLRLRTSLYPAGEALRDAGHQVLIGRFLRMVGSGWRVAREVPLPNLGDLRAWDLVLSIRDCTVGVECETRVRDVQALARRIHQRGRDGGADAILLILADTRANRAVVGELRAALGPGFATPTPELLNALRNGRPLPGPGVLLV